MAMHAVCLGCDLPALLKASRCFSTSIPLTSSPSCAGMFMIMGTLLVLDKTSKKGADKVQAFFNPALNWVQRWLPLFYVPTLVVLPQAVQGIGGAPTPVP